MAYRDGYINLARTLYGLETEEVIEETKLRSAISRAYYGVFNIAKDLLKDYGVIIPKKNSKNQLVNSHQFVIDWLQGSPDSELRLVGIKLVTLRYWRNKADYGDSVSNWKKNTNLLLRDAIEARGILRKPH